MDLNKTESVCETSTGRYEKLYLMLFAAIPSSILMIDRDMRILSANRNFLEKSRRSSANTIGHRLKEIFPAVIIEQFNLTHQIHEVFEKNLPTKGQRMAYRAPGVPMRFYYYRAFPFTCNGVVDSVMLLMDDVTEQIRLGEEVRRVEDHLGSVFESASDIILSTDVEGKILSWNRAAERISGYSLNEVHGRPFSNFSHEAIKKKVQDVFQRVKLRSISQMSEWELVPKHGEPVPVSWIFSPMKGEESKTVGIVAVGRDLTERRKLEFQLLQSQKFAALGVMAGGIAHEIRNPLAICSSAAQFLLDDDLCPEFRTECIEKILKGIRRASLIIENLLRFARPSPKSEMGEVNLSSLLKETLALITNQARIEKIDIQCHLPKDPVWIKGNFSLLQQVLINLFLNGIEAMRGGGTLILAFEKKGSEVAIHLTDTGRGISKKDLDKIFDPFYTTSPVGKGTGLGLSICYSIIKEHSGTIEMKSSEGKGSTFTIRLPVV